MRAGSGYEQLIDNLNLNSHPLGLKFGYCSPDLKKWQLYWICPVLPSFRNLSNENILGILWAQLLLQFSMERFETLQMFSAWNEDVRVVGI